MADMCSEVYVRNVKVAFSQPLRVECQYIAGHRNNRHSWQTLKDQDEVDLELLKDAKEDPTPFAIQDILDGLSNGTFDPYIEAILAAGHSRKRALRGVRGFPDLTKEQTR